MIKAVLFDLDGTLIDTNKLIYDSFDKTFKDKLGIELTREQIVDFFGRPLAESFQMHVKRDNVDDLISYYREYNESIHDKMCFAFNGVVELLKSLKEKGIKLGIVTSKREDLAVRGMKISGVYDYFDVIVTPESTKLHKPNAEPVLKACKDLNVEPKDAIMVGDSHYDIMCGNKAGCITCAVEYTYIGIEKIKEAKPDYIVKNAIDILNLV